MIVILYMYGTKVGTIGLLEVNRGLMCLVCNKGSARSIRNKKVVNLYSAEMNKNTFKRKVILGVC